MRHLARSAKRDVARVDAALTEVLGSGGTSRRAVASETATPPRRKSSGCNDTQPLAIVTLAVRALTSEELKNVTQTIVDCAAPAAEVA